MRRNLCLKIFITLIFCELANYSFSQAYNHYPINYYDFETNPAALTSSELHKRYMFFNSYLPSSKNPFFTTNFRYSKSLFSIFSGVGVSLSHSSFGNKASLSTLALSGAYRITIFNKIFLRFGTTYKLSYSNSADGNYDYYSFNSTGNTKHNSLLNNLNVSVALTTGGERFYASYSKLNQCLPWELSENKINVPTYHLLNIGNFFNLFHMEKTEMSYTGLLKQKNDNYERVLSQYLNFKFNFQINRRYYVKYGASIGHIGNEYYHFIPQLAFYNEKFAVSLSYGFHFKNRVNENIYKPAAQLNIIYLIWKKNNRRSRF